MEIKDIMQRLDASRSDDGIKTASTTLGNGTPTNPEALRSALRDALAAAPSKTASAPPTAQNPAGDLLKLAEDLTTAEEEAMMKQASIYGAAMCDGFMARFGQYEDAALQSPNVKTAQVAPLTAPAQPLATPDADLIAIKTAAANDAEFQKFASANPDLVKEAVDLGYRQTWDTLVKTAEADFDSGYGDCMAEMHKLASECYKGGALMINNILRQTQQAA